MDVTTIIKNLNYHVIIMYRHKESFNFFINGKIRYRLCSVDQQNQLKLENLNH